MQTHNYDTGINDSKKFLRHSSTRVKKLLEITLACSLTYKQEALILSFQDQFLERGSLSDKQLDVLEDIYERVNP